MGDKSKLISILITLSLLFSLIFFVNTVSADSITNIVTIPGVVNALINFTVPNDADTVYIKFDTDNDPTDGIQTYTDPTHLLNGEYYGSTGVDRHMFIRGLNESVTYSYALYLNGIKDTSFPYPTFTTLDRYTNASGWGDEFLDTYLVDTSTNIDYYQNIPTKLGSRINDTSLDTWNMISVLYQNSAYQIFSGPNNAYKMYHSSDAFGSNFGNFQDTGETCSENEVCWDNDNSRYVFIKQYKEGGVGNNQDIHVGNTTIGSETAWGTITKIYTQGSATYEPITVNNDTLGANSFIISNIWHNGVKDNRFCALFLGIPDGANYTKWAMIDGDRQHRTYSEGIGFKDNQFNGSDGFYGMSIMVRNQMYIGFAQILEGDADPGRMNFILTYSRNGYDWYPFIQDPDLDTETLIPFGSNGEWDDGIIRPDNMVLHTVGDEDRLYWTGSNGGHGEAQTDSGVSYSTVRTQGITYAQPTSSSGWIRTTSIPRWFSNNFTINGNFSDTSKLNISVLDADDDSVYSGFSFTDFTDITTNGTSLSCSWGSSSLGDIPTGEFKLNFSFDGSDGKLFSYNMDGAGFGEDDISFISINGQNNGTILQEQNRTFIWTNKSATYYQLQISNSSDFADTFLNLTDINETNYGVNYTESLTQVIFILPHQYNISYYGYHYYRVRPYTE